MASIGPSVVQDVKDQRLKANHNLCDVPQHCLSSGSRCQRSKIESKSQLLFRTLTPWAEWFKMSKIKDWKQITTWMAKKYGVLGVVQDVKDQRLKANHNLTRVIIHPLLVVQDVKDQRLKANHNPTLAISWVRKSGSRCQRSKIESKSQLLVWVGLFYLSGSRCQRSKIESKSQQNDSGKTSASKVVQDVKDQRLKANHN